MTQSSGDALAYSPSSAMLDAEDNWRRPVTTVTVTVTTAKGETRFAFAVLVGRPRALLQSVAGTGFLPTVPTPVSIAIAACLDIENHAPRRLLLA